MFCNSCGKEIADDAVVCVGCGRSVKPLNSSGEKRGIDAMVGLVIRTGIIPLIVIVIASYNFGPDVPFTYYNYVNWDRKFYTTRVSNVRENFGLTHGQAVNALEDGGYRAYGDVYYKSKPKEHYGLRDVIMDPVEGLGQRFADLGRLVFSPDIATPADATSAVSNNDILLDNSFSIYPQNLMGFSNSDASELAQWIDSLMYYGEPGVFEDEDYIDMPYQSDGAPDALVDLYNIYNRTPGLHKLIGARPGIPFEKFADPEFFIPAASALGTYSPMNFSGPYTEGVSSWGMGDDLIDAINYSAGLGNDWAQKQFINLNPPASMQPPTSYDSNNYFNPAVYGRGQYQNDLLGLASQPYVKLFNGIYDYGDMREENLMRSPIYDYAMRTTGGNWKDFGNVLDLARNMVGENETLGGFFEALYNRENFPFTSQMPGAIDEYWVGWFTESFQELQNPSQQDDDEPLSPLQIIND